MNATQNPADEIIALQKQNQALLQDIAINQALLVEMAQEREQKEKRKFWFAVIKSIFWIFLIFYSFKFTKDLTENLMGNMLGGAGNEASELMNKSDFNLSNLLKGGVDSDLQKELDRYLN